jgi:NAD(P)-dependent dehydrogenase (short-subunit alcohol dehydrogenase family)
VTEPSSAVAIVTGAGGDIGRAIVHGLRADGYNVLAADIDGSAAAATAAGNSGIVPFAADVTDATAVAAMADAARAIGKVGLLVNNAGRAKAYSLKELDATLLRADIALNLEAAFLCFKEVAEDLKTSSGVLINIASVNGLGVYGHPAYSAAKAGLIQFTKMVAVEYGKFGVRANSVAPGSVRTRTWEDRVATNPTVFEDIKRWYPLQRIADTTDVANAVRFLAGPLAKSITGVCLAVDCGLTAGQTELAHTFTQSDAY